VGALTVAKAQKHALSVFYVTVCCFGSILSTAGLTGHYSVFLYNAVVQAYL